MKSKLLGFGLAILTVALVGMVKVNAGEVVDTTRDCDKYDVIHCGTMSPNELRTEYDSLNTSKSNGSTTKQADIPKIFSALGISRAELNGTLGNEYKMGVVHRNGDVTVDGKVVARNAKTAARNLGGSAIAGTNAGVVSVSKMGSAQAAMVKMVKGKFVMAVMTPCGNPVSATPVTPPSAKCEALSVNKLSRNEFSFGGHASVTGGAKIQSYTFTVTDKKTGKVVGKPVVIKTDSLKANSGKMTFAKAGDYSVRLTLNTTAGDNITSTHCVKEFTVTPEEKPAVSIDKKVYKGNETPVDNIVVGVNQQFTYKVVVTNNGNINLKNVAVSDKQPAGVTFVAANVGSIANNMWRYVIPELKAGESKTYTITAKVPTYLAGKIKNTACVDAPAVPGSPDDCDDAYVEVPKPSAICEYVKTNYQSKTEFTLTGKASVKNDAKITAYVFTTKNAAGAVIDAQTVTTAALQATTDTITIETPGTYNVELVVKSSVGDLRSNACKTTVKIPEPKMVRVCDPSVPAIITVPEEEADNYKPVGDPACEPKVKQIEVCEKESGDIITINEVDFDDALHTKDQSKCDEPEEETPEVLVDTGVGSVIGLFASVTAAGALAHRMVWLPRRNG